MKHHQHTPPPQARAAAYYDKRADEFFHETVGLDLEHAYKRFLPRVARGGRILDAGCGSGRDSLYFCEQGYRVEAFDASAKMVERASRHTGLTVRQHGFAELDRQNAFDGIWCNASLIHLPHKEMGDAFTRLRRALAPAGVLYVSFKHGQGRRDRDGLVICALDEVALHTTAALGGLAVEQTWTTPDLRPGREDERWLHALLCTAPGK